MSEVELVQFVLQLLDRFLQCINDLVHSNLSSCAYVLDFIGQFAVTAAFVKNTAFGFERSQRSDEAFQFRETKDLLISFGVRLGDGNFHTSNFINFCPKVSEDFPVVVVELLFC